MSTEIIVNNDIIEINVTEEPIIIEAPSGAYPLPTGVYSVYGRTGNVVAQEGDYTLTLLGDVSIVTPSTGQVLRYNGTAWVNSTESYVGTVTSVAASVPTGLTITGSPITTSGTLAFGLQTGYSIPTTASQGTWDTAYNRSLTSAAVTGTTTKTLTLNQQSGGTITASWTDDNTDAVTSVFGRTGAVVATSGDYTTTQVTEGTNLYYTQTRFNSAFAAKSTTDLAEGTNLYYTDVRARASNSFVAGSGAYNSTTGVITIPTNNNQITNGAAYITLTSLSASAPLSYSNTTGAFSISQANTSTDGYLSSFDWNTFNNKQIALTLGNLTSSDITVTGGTGAVVGTGSTLTLATVNTNVGAYGTSTSVPTITVNGKGLVTAASQTAIPTASSSVTGLLTSANWSTFNDKQNQLNGTGFVKASGTTITYDNSTYLTTIEGIAAGGELSGTYASPSLVNSAVTGKVLTGVNVTGGSISATDSILTAFGKVQNQINGLIGGSIYKGTWNASTNTPTLASGVGTAGNYYIVSVAGTTNLDGITDWQVGDWAIFQGSVWQKVDNTDAVVSVNGFTGAVSLTTSNINEGTNLYYTDARARLSVSGGTGISYNSTSGVITNSAPDQTVTLTGAGTTSISGTYPSFTITSNDTYNGTVTSIGITESVAALSITGSPVTTSGNINIGFAGSPTQYVAGDGSLVTFPTIITEAQNLVAEVYNNTGATLTKGTIVYINGGQGNLPTVTKAIATSDPTSAQTFGFINVDLTNNNNGYVTIIGRLENMDTQAFANGTQLYLSGTTAGTYTSTKPQAPIHLVYVAIVVRSHPTQGVLEVKIQNGVEMDEIHDVQITSIANGNILQYSSANSLWHNVAGTTTNIAEGTNLYYTDTRARASISTTATGLTYTSGTGVLSLTAGYVIPTTTSATNWDTAYTNRITSATSPLSIAANVISIAQATTSTSGYLSSTDWNTFNGKQAALTNPVTGTGTTNYHTKFTGTSTIGNSLIWDNGTNVGIGNQGTTYTLDVSGTLRNTTSAYFATASGSVGIGTASPSDKFSVDAGTGNIVTSSFFNSTMTAGQSTFLEFGKNYSNNYNTGELAFKFVGDGSSSNMVSIGFYGAGNKLNVLGNGNVGIGTSSPSGKLHLSSTSDTYLVMTGGATPLTYSWLVDATNLRLFNGIGDTTLLTIASTGAATFSSNIGLGVTTVSSWGSVFRVLEGGDANNQSAIAFQNSANVLYLTTNSYFDTGWKYKFTDVAGQYLIDGADHRWYTAASGTAGNTLTWTQRMTLTNAGSLGIGTSSPVELLEVFGKGRFSIYGTAGINETLKLVSNANYNAGRGVKMGFYVPAGTNSEQLGAEIGSVTTASTSSDLFFNTTNAGVSTEAMRLTSDNHLKLTSTSAGGTNLDMYLIENDGLYINSNEGATGRAIYFQTGGTTRASITSVGSVIINSNNSSDALTVYGGISVWSISAEGSTTTNSSFGIVSTAGTSSSDTTFLARSRAGANYLQVRGDGLILSVSTYNVTTASSANMNIGTAGDFRRSTSSIRFKTDIENLSIDTTDILSKMRPIWYRSLGSTDRKDWSWYGFIAEELAEIEPRLVHWGYDSNSYEQIEIIDEEGNIKQETKLKEDAELIPDGVQYERITVFLVAELQKMRKEIDALKAK